MVKNWFNTCLFSLKFCCLIILDRRKLYESFEFEKEKMGFGENKG